MKNLINILSGVIVGEATAKTEKPVIAVLGGVLYFVATRLIDRYQKKQNEKLYTLQEAKRVLDELEERPQVKINELVTANN